MLKEGLEEFSKLTETGYRNVVKVYIWNQREKQEQAETVYGGESDHGRRWEQQPKKNVII